MSVDTGDIDGEGGDGILVAEYVLGLLDAGNHQAVAARIAADPALRREARLWRARFAQMDAGFEEIRPPAHVLDAIEQRMFGAPAGKAAGWWNSLLVWRSLAGGALAVAVIAVGLNLFRAPPVVDATTFAAQFVAALREEGSEVSLVALYDARTASVHLVALSGASVPERDFELWAIEGQSAPVAVGLVNVEGSTDVTLPATLPVRVGEGTVFAVTLEPKGGSPSGSPTGPIVARGAATPI